MAWCTSSLKRSSVAETIKRCGELCQYASILRVLSNLVFQSSVLE
jgi:hypothetical protein